MMPENRNEYNRVVSQREKRDLKPRKIYLDLGHFVFPFPETGLKEIPADEMYVGVDIRQHLNNSRYPDNFHFVEADGKDLPIADGSIDEVYVGNLFGEPSQGQKSKLEILPELKRILSDNGEVVLAETLTPKATPFSLDELPSILDKYGFEVVDLVTQDDEEKWKREISQYNIHASRVYTHAEIMGRRFLIRFKKKPQQSNETV
ncbi:MAG: class I SAM-dependent methyltransferase [Candidatus Doudnabacteria bacterium]